MDIDDPLNLHKTLELPRPLFDSHARPNTPPRPAPLKDDGVNEHFKENYAERTAWLCHGMVFQGHQSFYSPSFASSKEHLEYLQSSIASHGNASRRNSTARRARRSQAALEELTTLASSARNQQEASSIPPYRIMLSRIFDANPTADTASRPVADTASRPVDVAGTDWSVNNSRVLLLSDSDDDEDLVTDQDLPPLVPHNFATASESLEASPPVRSAQAPLLPISQTQTIVTSLGINDRHATSTSRMSRRDPAEDRAFWDYHLALERVRRQAEAALDVTPAEHERSEQRDRARERVRAALAVTDANGHTESDSMTQEERIAQGTHTNRLLRWAQREHAARTARQNRSNNSSAALPHLPLSENRQENHVTSHARDWLARRTPPRRRSEWLASHLSSSQRAQTSEDSPVSHESMPVSSDPLLHDSSGLDLDAYWQGSGSAHLPPFSHERLSQTLSTDQPGRRGGHLKDQWDVKVFIHDVDWERGVLSGVMEAQNVPRTSIKVCTHFSGEIVDGINHHLFRPTYSWQSTADKDRQRKTDQQFWAQLSPFAHFVDRAKPQPEDLKNPPKCAFEFVGDNKSYQLIKEGSWNYGQDGWLLMRWKERNFVNLEASQSNLTIAGFYYIALSRKTGAIEGLYLDPISTPYQRLNLRPATCSDQPMLASYDVL